MSDSEDLVQKRVGGLLLRETQEWPIQDEG